MTSSTLLRKNAGVQKNPHYTTHIKNQAKFYLNCSTRDRTISSNFLLQVKMKMYFNFYVDSVWGVSRIIEHIRLIIPIPADTFLRHLSKWTQWETPPSMSNTRYFVLEMLISLQKPT